MIANLVFGDGSGGKEAAKTEGKDSGNSKRVVNRVVAERANIAHFKFESDKKCDDSAAGFR